MIDTKKFQESAEPMLEKTKAGFRLRELEKKMWNALTEEEVMNMEEIWKDIPDTGGYYQVSNLGNVRSVDRDKLYSDGTIHHHKGRIIKPSMNQYGYLQTHYTTTEGKTKAILLHRLVALNFVDGYAEGLQVNHKDENKLNNRADNLEWCTPQENIVHGTGTKRRAEKYKEVSYADRCKTLVVYKDGAKVGEFNGYKEAGEALGVTADYISFVANGQRKSKRYKVEIKKSRSYKIGIFKDGELVSVHPSLASASKAIGSCWHFDRKYIRSGGKVHGYTLKELDNN